MALCVAVFAISGCSSPPPPPLLDPRVLLAELREASPALPADGLDPDAAVALALAHDPNLALLREERAITAAIARAEAAWRNPEFRPSLANLFSSASQPVSLALSLRLFLPRPGEGDAQAARAAALDAKAVALIEWRAAQLEAEVRVAHARVVRLEEETALADAALALHERILAAVAERLAARAATRADHVLAQLRREELLDQRGELDLQRAAAHAELAALIGAEPGLPIAVRRGTELDTASPPLSELPVPRELEEQALARRGDVRALQQEHAAAQQALALVRDESGFWPGFLEPKAERDSRERSLGLSAGFELPLFDSGDAELAVEEARVEQARTRYSAALAGARCEIELARVTCQETERRRQRQSARLAPLLTETEAVVRSMMTAGEGDLTRLLALDARLLEARCAAVRAAFEAERARIGFALATGALAPRSAETP